jgi:hypothetical protein
MMKYLFLIVLFLPMLAVAQQKDLTDSTEFRYGLPVSNDDTTKRVRSDQDPANQWVEVPGSGIPRKLKRALERNDVYEGWEKGKIFYDKSINQYLLRIRNGNAVTTYGFAADGSSVSFTEENIVSVDSVN